MISTNPIFDGLDYFIAAAGAVISIFPNYIFFMIGKMNYCSPEYIEEVEKKIKDLRLNDNFIFTGFRTDIPDILADITILIEPMQNGAWSRVILEAMSAGVPVIGVEEDKVSDFLENEITGILVSRQIEIGDALINLIQDNELQKKIAANAKKHVENNFSSEKYANNIMTVYHTIK